MLVVGAEQKALKDFFLSKPSISVLRIGTEKLEALYLKKIADLEELKKSILHKAFAGELNM